MRNKNNIGFFKIGYTVVIDSNSCIVSKEIKNNKFMGLDVVGDDGYLKEYIVENKRLDTPKDGFYDEAGGQIKINDEWLSSGFFKVTKRK